MSTVNTVIQGTQTGSENLTVMTVGTDVPAKGKFELSFGQTKFTVGTVTQNDPLMALGYNHRPNGGPLDPNENYLLTRYEADYLQPDGSHAMEWYLEYGLAKPGTTAVAVRPLFFNIRRDTHRVTALINANSINFSEPNPATPSASPVFLNSVRGTTQLYPPASGNTSLIVRAGTSARGRLLLGYNNNNSYIDLEPGPGGTQAQLLVNGRAYYFNATLSGVAGTGLSIGDSNNDAALRVVNTGAAGTRTAIFRARVSQTANILETQDSTGAAGMAIDANRRLKFFAGSESTVANTGPTTVKLPANPVGFFSVTDSAGNLRKIPYYAA